MFLILSITCVIGCLWPSVWVLPGIVTSIVSALSFSSWAFSSKAVFTVSNFASISLLTSLASCPITGRSSFERLPIPLSICVNSPFLPKISTLKLSRACKSLTWFNFSNAAILISLSFSFIVLYPFYDFKCKNNTRFGNKKTPLKRDEKTRYHPNSYAR